MMNKRWRMVALVELVGNMGIKTKVILSTWFILADRPMITNTIHLITLFILH